MLLQVTIIQHGETSDPLFLAAAVSAMWNVTYGGRRGHGPIDESCGNSRAQLPVYATPLSPPQTSILPNLVKSKPNTTPIFSMRAPTFLEIWKSPVIAL